MSKPCLYLVGTPLSENAPLSESAIAVLNQCDAIIGESRPVLDRYLKGQDLKAERFHLDPPRKDEMELLWGTLQRISEIGGVAALLSDVGMPVLFDPGFEVLEKCRKLGFLVRTVPSPTSWATACAVSGWSPPFLIQGFLDRDNAIRAKELKSLKASTAHLVLMETPYRFRKFLEQITKTFGDKRQAFLAWEIAKSGETYVWGTLSEISRYAEQNNLEKGEFVLLLKA